MNKLLETKTKRRHTFERVFNESWTLAYEYIPMDDDQYKTHWLRIRLTMENSLWLDFLAIDSSEIPMFKKYAEFLRVFGKSIVSHLEIENLIDVQLEISHWENALRSAKNWAQTLDSMPVSIDFEKMIEGI